VILRVFVAFVQHAGKHGEGLKNLHLTIW
jgi:hypothetical protein